MKRLLLGPLVALAACSSHKSPGTLAPRPHPIHVETVVVEQRDVPNTLLLAGSLKANQESELAANASGRVTRTFVERGTYVAKGQPIAQLDTRMAALSASEAEANVATARTQKAAAERECERAAHLFQRGIITQQEYDRQTTSCKTALSSTEAAESHVRYVKQQLVDGTVRAPFPGLVSERYVSVGEYVMPSTRVAHVVDIDPLRLELTVPEQNIAAVREGLKVTFQVAAFPDRTFTGVVSYIGPAVRANTRDLVFEARVPNQDKLLRPGLFATASLDVGTQKVPVVPRAALKPDGDTTRAFAIVDKHVEERIVEAGSEQGGVVAIPKGLRAGERVVVHPSDEVVDGVEVE